VRIIRDPATVEAIIDVLIELPDSPREFAIDNCVFISVGYAAQGQTVNTNLERDWLIAVHDQAPKLEPLIAHEIAHAVLGHTSGTPDNQRESEADKLATEWRAFDSYRRITGNVPRQEGRLAS
jgi:hypothetical protein